MTVYSKNELWFPRSFIYDNFCNYFNIEKESYKEQLHELLLIKQQGCGSFTVECFAPFPIHLFKLLAGPNKNDDFIKIINWIFFKLWTCLPSIQYYTIEVRLRIASCMLEKLYLNNIITKDDFIWIDTNLKTNVRKITYSLIEEDLPF